MKVLSDYFRKKIDLATLLNAYAVHLFEVEANKLNDPHLIHRNYLPFLFGKDKCIL